MDSDGEDRPNEISELIKKIKLKPELSVVAKRIKRSEGIFFRFLYETHKLITFIFTGKKINFGNYSCLTKKDSFNISNQGSLWSSFSGTLKKKVKNLNEINSIRGVRYFGPSKMSLISLILHSFAIIGVFKNIVFTRSIVIIFFLFLVSSMYNYIPFILGISLIIFNLMILMISLREKKDRLEKSNENILTIENIIH